MEPRFLYFGLGNVLLMGLEEPLAADVAGVPESTGHLPTLNTPIVGLVGKLAAAGYPLGVLANVSEPQWSYCTSRFRMLSSVFSVHALSFRLGCHKPDAEAFAAAAELAQIEHGQIFYTDERAENVAAALAFGWDAEVYLSVSQINEALRKRDIVVNY